jgi:hypothetical protein
MKNLLNLFSPPPRPQKNRVEFTLKEHKKFQTFLKKMMKFVGEKDAALQDSHHSQYVMPYV